MTGAEHLWLELLEIDAALAPIWRAGQAAYISKLDAGILAMGEVKDAQREENS